MIGLNFSNCLLTKDKSDALTVASTSPSSHFLAHVGAPLTPDHREDLRERYQGLKIENNFVLLAFLLCCTSVILQHGGGELLVQLKTLISEQRNLEIDKFIRVGNAKRNKAVLEGGVENRDFLRNKYKISVYCLRGQLLDSCNFNFCQISLEFKIKVEEERYFAYRREK